MLERDRTSCKGGKKQAMWMAHRIEKRCKVERNKFITDRVGMSLCVCILWD